MAKKALGNLDDALSALPITDFSGGLNTYTSGLSLKSNESPEMLNVIPFIGRLLYRGGYLEYSPTTAAADQEYAFYDSLGNKHLVVWRNGGLVDTITGAESAVENAVYNAGQRVGVVDLNGILYWSTQTTHLRFWNPVAGTTGAVAQTGVSPPPASPLLMLYTNAIVAFGVDYTGTYQATVMGWSAVNAPTNWDAANSQAVGPRTIATLEFGLVMGIAEVGVAPFRTFVVGRSDKGLIAYTGALGSLSETLISCPVGCADGASAQFAPSAEKFGTIIFLGTDGQFYSTNGVTCDPISVVHDASGIRGIQPTLSAAFADALVTAGNRFWSGYNEAYQYYFCTVAGQQFVYKWDLKCWTLFQGWPVGPCVNFTDLTGLPQMYIAANTPLVVNDVATFMVAEVALPNLDDNGTVPRVYYKTPWLHMGNPKKFKEYHWISPQFYAKGAIYKVTGQSLPRAIDNSSMVTKPLLFTTPVGVNPYEFELDVSELDGSDLLGGPGDGALVGTGNPVVSFGRLVCNYVPSGMLAGLTGMKEILKGSAAQFTVELYPDSLVCDFELLGLEILWLDRGYMRDAGNKYNPESGVPYGFPGYPAAFDPMMPPELQLSAVGGTAPNAYRLRKPAGHTSFAKQMAPSTNWGAGIAYGLSNVASGEILAWDSVGNSATIPFQPIAMPSLDNPYSGLTFSGLIIDGADGVAFGIGDVYELSTGDQGVQIFTAAPAANKLSGAFNNPGAIVDIGHVYLSANNNLALTQDRQYLYFAAEELAPGTGSQVYKVSLATGAIVAQSAAIPRVAGQNTIFNLFVLPSGSKVIAVTFNGSAIHNANIYVFDSALGTLATVPLTVGDYTGVGVDLSSDGSQLAVATTQGSIGPPTNLRCYIMDTATYTLSSFGAGPLLLTSTRSFVSFLKGDNANVVIGIDATAQKYSTAGVPSTLYGNVIANGSGTRDIINARIDQTTGYLFGNSSEYNLAGPYTVFAYDLVNSIPLSEVATANLVFPVTFDTT